MKEATGIVWVELTFIIGRFYTTLEIWGRLLVNKWINSKDIIAFIILNTQILEDSFMAKLLPM